MWTIINVCVAFAIYGNKWMRSHSTCAFSRMWWHISKKNANANVKCECTLNLHYISTAFYMWISRTDRFHREMFSRDRFPGSCAPLCRQYKSNEFLAVFCARLSNFMSALNYERCYIHWNLIKHAKKLYNIMPDIWGLWAIWPNVVSLESCLQWICCRFYPVNNSTFREISVLIQEACFPTVVWEQRTTHERKEFHWGSTFPKETRVDLFVIWTCSYIFVSMYVF